MRFDDLYASLLERSQAKGVGLAGLRVLLAKLGNPQKKMNSIHVAGTNGKGSVCALLARTLTCGGYRTGLFVSPHLISPTERIQIDGKCIGKKAFAAAVQKVLACETKKLNFFEILTSAAFVYFAQQKVQYAVLETGLGGRKDPTNICVPILSVITSIGLDHTQILGNTLTKIATEKAGIIKQNTPVFCGPLPPAAQKVICQRAESVHAPLQIVKEGEPFSLCKINWPRNQMILALGKERWPLHLVGDRQPQNACLVYQICTYLKVPHPIIKKSFRAISFPCRWETFCVGGQTWILDGAHNPQAVQSLLKLWKKHPAYPHAALFCGFMKDKNYKKMLQLLCPHFEQVIITVPPSSRGAKASDFGPFLRRPGLRFLPNYEEILALPSSQKIIFCTGSFYLVGGVRRLLTKKH